MISKKIFVFTGLLLGALYHLIMYFDFYGPSLGNAIANSNSFLALASTMILIFLYIATKWRLDGKGSNVVLLFDLLIVWVFICYFRSFLNIYRPYTLKEMLFSPYIGLSLFPILFFIIGINAKYFYLINRIFFLYCPIVFLFSIPYIGTFELQFFLLMPLFYVIVTYPMQSTRDKIITLVIAIVIFATSLTNRAGIMRISASYMIVIFFYLALKMRISKKLINAVVVIMLIVPFYLLYIGVKGKDVMTQLLGENTQGGYRQENIRADTRTFLYVDALRDLKLNRAYILGKGMNAGYASPDFDTFNRLSVEVGFLGILLKTGGLGFLLYISIIISAIFKALNNSNNSFIKYLGLVLTAYIIMLFVENLILFNLFNILIWIIVGMCHSRELRDLNDKEIRILYKENKLPETL